MKKIGIKFLELEGFRSFLDRSRIEFNNSGLTLISGKDLRTGGSNGSGKSSILEAIYWTIGASPIPATELKNYNAKTISTKLGLSIDGKDWVVEKTHKSLEIFVDGKPMDGLKSSMLERLQAELGGIDIFESLSYRRQSDLGNFFYNQDSKIKSFFVKCLPELSRLEEISDAAQSKMTAIKTSISFLESTISDTEEKIKHLKSSDELDLLSQPLSSSIKSLGSEILDLNLKITQKESEIINIDKQIQDISVAQLPESVSAKISSFENNLKSLELNINNHISNLNLKRRELVGAMNSKSDKCNDITLAISEFTRKLCSVDEKEQEIKDIDSDIVNIKKKIEHVSSNTCYTCNQKWPDSQNAIDGLSSDILKLEAAKVSIQKDINDIKSQVPEHESLTASFALLRSELEQDRSSLSDIDGEINSNKMKISGMKIKVANSIEELKKSHVGESTAKLLGLKNEHSQYISSLKSEINSRMNEISSLKDRLNQIQKEKSDYSYLKNTLDDLQLKLKAEQGRLMIEEDVFNVTGKRGVLGLYFEVLVKEIEQEANELVSKIPNTSDITIEISTKKETKSGTKKNAINTKIYKGAGEISFRSLSGGQQATLSLCVDLAMTKALKRRVNVSPSWVALDEAMDGMDNESKSSAIELISNFLPESLVLVIDHSTEIKEAFNNTIEVEYNGKTSGVANGS